MGEGEERVGSVVFFGFNIFFSVSFLAAAFCLHAIDICDICYKESLLGGYCLGGCWRRENEGK